MAAGKNLRGIKKLVRIVPQDVAPHIGRDEISEKDVPRPAADGDHYDRLSGTPEAPGTNHNPDRQRKGTGPAG